MSAVIVVDGLAEEHVVCRIDGGLVLLLVDAAVSAYRTTELVSLLTAPGGVESE